MLATLPACLLLVYRSGSIATKFKQQRPSQHINIGGIGLEQNVHVAM